MPPAGTEMRAPSRMSPVNLQFSICNFQFSMPLIPFIPPSPFLHFEQRLRDPKMTNYEIARIFSTLADLMEVQGENVFKVRAYRKAADTIEGLTESLASLAERGQLESVPNIGKGIAEKIEEIERTGKLGLLEAIRAEGPAGLPEILN